MKRPLLFLISLAAVLFSPLLSAQQQTDAQSNPSEDSPDIVAQVQQLRAEVEQLSEQVDRLNNEIKSMRTTGAVSAGTPTRGRTAGKPSTPASTPAPVATTSVPAAQNDESVPITVLVFRDGQKVETRNYAIVGESIWVYNERESKKYRVADLDVDATRQLNSAHGVGFQLPPTR